VKAWIEARGLGAVEVRPGKTGQFDVVAAGRVAYSRYETGRFPTEADLAKMQL